MPKTKHPLPNGQKRKFSNEYKHKVAQEAIECRRANGTYRPIIDKYMINPSMLRRWITEYDQHLNPVGVIDDIGETFDELTEEPQPEISAEIKSNGIQAPPPRRWNIHDVRDSETNRTRTYEQYLSMPHDELARYAEGVTSMLLMIIERQADMKSKSNMYRTMLVRALEAIGEND